MTEHELTVAIQEAQLACLRGKRGAYDLVQALELAKVGQKSIDDDEDFSSEREAFEETISDLENDLSEARKEIRELKVADKKAANK